MNPRNLLRAWDVFWFAPASPVPVAVYRILLGLIVLHYGVLLAPELLLWLGESGTFSLDSAREFSRPYTTHLIGFLPARDAWVIGFYAVLMTSALTLTVGLFTRTSAVMTYLCLLAFHNRNPFILNSADIFMRLSVLWLGFSQAGAAISVDRLRRVARGEELGPLKPRSPVGQRLIQCQLAIMYFSTSFWKVLKGQGSWFDGTAMYYALRLEVYQRLPVPVFLDQMWVYQALSLGTIVAESALWSLIWLPRYRYWALASGVGLHLGVDCFMNIPLFSLVTLATYVTFVPSEHLTQVMAAIRHGIRRRWGESTPVFYDGDCGLCVRSVRVLSHLDLFRRLSLIDFRQPGSTAAWRDFDAKRAEGELLVRSAHGRWYGGFLAFRWMAWRLPLGWGIAPWLYVPGIAWLGQHIYALVARNRLLCFGRSCETGACRLHRHVAARHS